MNNRKHPKDTPLNQWPSGWLKMEVASLLDTLDYIMMCDHEKTAAGYPVTEDEMRNLIRGRREADAYLLNPD